MARPARARRNLLFWSAGAAFAAAFGILLFFSQPLFLRDVGVKARLLAEAERLRGGPAARVSAEVGRALKAYLDASKHVSRAEVAVAEASARRLVFSVTVPWAETMAKKQRQRARSIVRLAADLLRRAGAGGVAVVVRVRRRRKDPEKSDAVGIYIYDPAKGRFAWRPVGR